jgi:hypothetical protein
MSRLVCEVHSSKRVSGSHLWRPNGVRFASTRAQRVTSGGKPLVHAQEI